MKFTQERADAFIDGNLRIHSTGGGYLYQGLITVIKLEDNKLHIKLKWLASHDGGGLNAKDNWTKSSDNYNCVIDLSLEATDKIGGISFLSSSGEVTTLIPPSGNKLDPARVHGL